MKSQFKFVEFKVLPILEKIVYTLQVHMFEKKGSEKYEQKEI